MTCICTASWSIWVRLWATFICNTGFIVICTQWVRIVEWASNINFFTIVWNLLSTCLSVLTNIGRASWNSKCSAIFISWTWSITCTRISWICICKWAGEIDSLGFWFITVIRTALNSSYITIRGTSVCLFGSLLRLDALISSSIRSTVSIWFAI